jgi:hypothetical protein
MTSKFQTLDVSVQGAKARQQTRIRLIVMVARNALRSGIATRALRAPHRTGAEAARLPSINRYAVNREAFQRFNGLTHTRNGTL